MKSFTEFINESSNVKSIFKDLTLYNFFRKYIESYSNKENVYSLENQTDMSKFYKEFIEKVFGAFGYQQNKTIQKAHEYGFDGPNDLRRFIITNAEKLHEKNFKLNFINQYNLKGIEKEYKEWENSKDYVDSVKDDNYDEDRVLVIYNRWDPEQFDVYPFKGKRGKQTDHQVNMLKMKFHYDNDVKYYECYPILGKNYFKNLNEIKKRAQEQLGYDIIGYND